MVNVMKTWIYTSLWNILWYNIAEDLSWRYPFER